MDFHDNSENYLGAVIAPNCTNRIAGNAIEKN